MKTNENRPSARIRCLIHKHGDQSFITLEVSLTTIPEEMRAAAARLLLDATREVVKSFEP